MKGLDIKRIITWMLCLTGLLMSSCIRNNKLDDTKNRTVLVYICGDNSLSNIANSNIYSMNSCISNGMDNDNLLVFVDRKGIPASLLHIHNFKIDTVAVYPDVDSTDPKVLRMVIDEMEKNWKAEHYGLIMWSHGTGWIPTKQLHFVGSNMNYAQMRDDKMYSNEGLSVLERQRFPHGTKAFGWKDLPGQTPNYKCMEVDDLVEGIPDGVFDYIVFDACYMGNVEIAYALRNKADYIISSCFEIVSYGFPYHIVTRDFMNGNLIKSCNEFHKYYNSMSGWEQMAGVSLVKTEGLDSLARCFRKIVNGYGEHVVDMDVSKVQHFDRFNRHVFYDLEDFVVKLGTPKDLMNEFRLQLENSVTFKITTPYIFPDDPDSIKVNSYCGLSVYIPLRDYEASGLNNDYRMTEWSLDTDYR